MCDQTTNTPLADQERQGQGYGVTRSSACPRCGCAHARRARHEGFEVGIWHGLYALRARRSRCWTTGVLDAEALKTRACASARRPRRRDLSARAPDPGRAAAAPQGRDRQVGADPQEARVYATRIQAGSKKGARAPFLLATPFFLNHARCASSRHRGFLAVAQAGRSTAGSHQDDVELLLGIARLDLHRDRLADEI